MDDPNRSSSRIETLESKKAAIRQRNVEAKALANATATANAASIKPVMKKKNRVESTRPADVAVDENKPDDVAEVVASIKPVMKKKNRVDSTRPADVAVDENKPDDVAEVVASIKPVMKKMQQRVDSTRPADVVVDENKPDDVAEVVEVTERGFAESDDVVEVVRSGNGEIYAEGKGAGGDVSKGCHKRVQETIRSFVKHFFYFVQQENTRCRKAEFEDKAKAKRPDLKSLTYMQNSNLTLVPKNRIGSIPGVDVGHHFYSRCEMVTVGFHNHWLNGIDWIGVSKKNEYPEYQLPISVAIVMSCMYEGDVDNSADIIYTGQGGNNNNRQIGDQEMVRGNLGLKNSMAQNLPVRVIRGHESGISYVGKVYTYYGLYKVVEYWAEKKSGFTVYKFKLKRVPGQPHLLTEQVFFAPGAIPNSVVGLRGLVCKDISGGLENIPIPATNVVDDPAVPPTGLTYIRSLKLADNVTRPSSASGCGCKGSCTDPDRCACARLNGSSFPYVHLDGGRLIEAKSVVFECGPNCRCDLSCVNRTTQRGLKYRLEVYKTSSKGWAVRSRDFIPSGAFVCEYLGVLKKTEDAHYPDNMYVMDILQTIMGLGQRQKRLGDVPISVQESEMQDTEAGKDNTQFCIDAGTSGNVTRYINHSCQPNLFAQCVLSAHHDLAQARVILFAADNIQPLKELTYDYGYALDSVVDSEGNIRQLPCYCEAPDCRKRMF